MFLGLFLNPGVRRHYERNPYTLGSEIYWEPLLDSFVAGAQRVFPALYLMEVGRKVASTHQPTESQLHVAAAEKKRPCHVAKGLSYMREPCI